MVAAAAAYVFPRKQGEKGSQCWRDISRLVIKMPQVRRKVNLGYTWQMCSGGE